MNSHIVKNTVIEFYLNGIKESFNFGKMDNGKHEQRISSDIKKGYKDYLVKNLLEGTAISNKEYKEITGYYPVGDKEELQDIIIQQIGHFGKQCNLNWLDVSRITDMSGLFDSMSYEKYDDLALSEFNGDISMWDVSNVTNMEGMFKYSYFDGNLSKWDVSSVQNMKGMFALGNFSGKKGGIGKWDVSSVQNMALMFFATPFNCDISGWDVSNVTNMEGMFQLAKFFNQHIGEWDVSSVTTMKSMFQECSSFNDDISRWDVSNVKDDTEMFLKCPLSIGDRPEIHRF